MQNNAILDAIQRNGRARLDTSDTNNANTKNDDRSRYRLADAANTQNAVRMSVLRRGNTNGSSAYGNGFRNTANRFDNTTSRFATNNGANTNNTTSRFATNTGANRFNNRFNNGANTNNTTSRLATNTGANRFNNRFNNGANTNNTTSRLATNTGANRFNNRFNNTNTNNTTSRFATNTGANRFNNTNNTRFNTNTYANSNTAFVNTAAARQRNNRFSNASNATRFGRNNKNLRANNRANNENAIFSPTGLARLGWNDPASRRPRLQFGNNGRLVDDNFQSKPALPLPAAACTGSLGANGLRGQSFRQCFVDSLRRAVKPAMNAATAAVGNAAKMNAMCSQTSMGPHQTVVYELAKLMANVPPERLGEHRGLLVYHSAGSGKTVSSLAIIMAFWPTQKRIVLVSSKSNTNQALQSYKREAVKFFPREVQTIVDEYRARKNAPHLSVTEAFDEAIGERVKGLTFVEARNRIAAKHGEFKTIKDIKLYGGAGSVLIIDEAQGLAMKSRADPNGDAIKLGCALRALPKDKLRKIHVFAMTATPGNTVREWLKLLSVVRRADQSPFVHDNDTGTNAKGRVLCEHRAVGAGADALVAKIESDLAKGSMAFYQALARELFGLVSYVDIRSDMSRHACVREREMKMEMDRYYFALMLQANAKDRRGQLRSASDRAQHVYDPRYPDAFMKKMRILGNSLPKTLWSMLPRPIQEELVRRGRILKINSTSEGRYVSNKLISLAASLTHVSGKQYVYTVSGNESLLAFALRTWYDVQDVTRRAETFDGAHVDPSTGRVVGIPEATNCIVLTDTITKDHRERLVGIFNSAANASGKYIRFVIATGQLYEGLDLKGLRYVHLCDPLPSPLQEIQAIGRGPRNCSHAGLPLPLRRVTVVRWYSAAPSGGWQAIEPLLGTMRGMRGRIGPDQVREEYDRLNGTDNPSGTPRAYDEYVRDRSLTDPSFTKLYNFQRVMQSLAIDCQVLAPYHPDVTCGSAPRYQNTISMSAGRACVT